MGTIHVGAMVLDLNRALLFGDYDGCWRSPLVSRNYLCIVDGVVGGEGNGPLSPQPVNSGFLLCGGNPAEIDAIACKLMGFDPVPDTIGKGSFCGSPYAFV